ncbi:TetR/AcrR family transcriptional regulator [Paenibacillus sp. NPDC056933]|uniref:TetR/AcrR family transcriptional regulator n=1 Tax=Paenibacillus sp. NPDC056933 TaxID=3345968 RepID=UPI0036354777
MSSANESSSDKILSVTVKLMSEKGYKAVTIKEIATAAGISEMTVFRTFGCKKAILDKIIENYLYSAPIDNIVQERITFDLEADLKMLSKFYQDMVNKNQEVYLISIMERNTMPEIHLSIHNNVTKFISVVIEYMKTMQQKGKVITGDPVAQALTLMQFNYGKFVANTLTEGTDAIRLTNSDYLNEAVSIIAKGLKP